MKRHHPFLMALLGLILLVVAPGLMGARTPYAPKGTPPLEYQTKTVIFKLAPAGVRSWRGAAHNDWAAYFAIADQVVNLTRQQLAHDWVANVDYGDTDVIRTYIAGVAQSYNKRANVTDSLTHSRYMEISQGGQEVAATPQINAQNKFPCTITHTSGNTYQRYGLLYMPFEDYLPSNVEIVTAKLMMMTDLATSTNVTNAKSDTLYAVLDTVAADSAWYTGRLTAYAATAYFRGQRCASWNNQRQPAGKGYATTGRNYPAAASADSFPWTPALASRSRSIDWGPRGAGYVPAANLADDASLAIDITRPMQYIVNGARNNGLWLQYWDNSTWNFGGTPNNNASFVRLHTWNADSTNASPDSLKTPWVVVQYREGKQGRLGPYPNGAEVLFTFCTDDGKKSTNAAYTAIFKNRHLAYTIFVNGQHNGVTTYYDAGDLVNWFNDGMEIGSHGRKHATIGLRTHTMTATGYDSLVVDMSPGWIDSLMATVGEQDSAYYANTGRVGDVYALANNRWNLNAVAVACSLGYEGVRAGALGTFESSGDTLGCYLDGTAANAWLRGYGWGMPSKHQFLLAPYIWNDYTLYTEDGLANGAKEADSTKVKRRIRLAIEDRAVRGLNGYWILFTHANFDEQGSYTGAIDADQLRWTLNAMQEAGNVHISTFGEGMRLLRRNGIEYAHPAYGTAAWQSRLDADLPAWWRGRVWK